MHKPLHVSLPLAICLNTHSFRWNTAESILGVFEKLNSLKCAATACSWKLPHFWLSVELQRPNIWSAACTPGLTAKPLLCALLSRMHHAVPRERFGCLLAVQRSMGARVPQHRARAALQMSDRTPRGSYFENSVGSAKRCCSNKIAPTPDLVFPIQLKKHVSCLWFFKSWLASWVSLLFLYFFVLYSVFFSFFSFFLYVTFE